MSVMPGAYPGLDRHAGCEIQIPLSRPWTLPGCTTTRTGNRSYASRMPASIGSHHIVKGMNGLSTGLRDYGSIGSGPNGLGPAPFEGSDARMRATSVLVNGLSR